MWSSNAFLKRCEKLKECGLLPEFERGARVARGFADLGYEEFYCLSSAKLVSIFTGHTSALNSEHHAFFFLVPNLEYLVNTVSKKGFDVESFAYLDQRQWVVRLRSPGDDRAVETKDAELLCALADAFIEISTEAAS